MRLALALQTVVGLALLVAVAAGVDALLRSGPVLAYPWPPLTTLRVVVALVLLSACWLVVNVPVEGRTLLVVAKGHGLTTADLVVLPPLAVAGLLAARAVVARLG